MPHRQKILILENDDFLREILGNLLHKRGGYLFSAFSLDEGLRDVQNHTLDTVILGTSCSEYKGKETLSYIRKHLGQINPPNFFIINSTDTELDFIPSEQQIKISELSIEKIINAIPI